MKNVSIPNLFEMLLSRLSWPDSMSRLIALQEIVDLLEADLSGSRLAVFLQWMRTRELEIDSVLGLCILSMCGAAEHFGVRELAKNVSRPSVLSSHVICFIKGIDDLDQFQYSILLDAAPDTFYDPEFSKRVQVMPGIYMDQLQRLEELSSLQLVRQWAWEWRRLIEKGHPKSFEPHHFISGSRDHYETSLIPPSADVFASAYLRVLTMAAKYWGIPVEASLYAALDMMPVDLSLSLVKPQKSPRSLAELSFVESDLHDFLASYSSASGDTLIALNAPMGAEYETGTRNIELRTFIGPVESKLSAAKIWNSISPEIRKFTDYESLRFSFGRSETVFKNIDSFCANGLLPLTARFFLVPLPRWIVGLVFRDIFGLVPLLPELHKVEVQITRNRIEFSLAGERIGHWWYWLDRWAPDTPKGSGARIGSAMAIDTSHLDNVVANLEGRCYHAFKQTTFNREAGYGEYDETESFIIV